MIESHTKSSKKHFTIHRGEEILQIPRDPGNLKIGMKAMHRGTQLTYVYPEKIEEYEKEGWILGAFKKKH